MRKITYIIDDSEISNLIGEIPFKVIYSLKKDKKGISYELTDFEKNPININSLNGYQRMFTNECFKSFSKEIPIKDEYQNNIKIMSKFDDEKFKDTKEVGDISL